MSVQEASSKKVPTRLTKPSTLGTYLIRYPFQIKTNNRVVAKIKKQGEKLGYYKGSKTGNDLYKFKELKKKKSNFKRKIKAPKRKILQ